MGYFPTGQSIRCFQETICARCVHHTRCALWSLQLLNREEANHKDNLLHKLIATTPKTLECKKFHPEDGRQDRAFRK